MKIAIGSDHGGYKTKEYIREWLDSEALPYSDFGTFSDESVDFPVFAHLVCKSIESEECNIGILVCSTGQGMAITSNRYENIRAALCWNKKIAEMSRRHNNANVLVLPGLYISEQESVEILKDFLFAAFEGGRHQKRLNLINQD